MFKRTALLHASAILCLLALAGPAAAESGLTAPATLGFGSVDIHFSVPDRQSLLVSNTSGEAIQLGVLALGGPDSGDFAPTNDGCSSRLLPASGNCTIELGFQPHTKGAATATLEVPTGESTLQVALTGTGTTGTLSATPNPLQFGPTPYTPPGTHEENEPGEDEELKISTDNAGGVQTEAISIVGPDASSFSIPNGSCANALFPSNNTCGMRIHFEPTSPGLKHATLIIANDGEGGTLSIPLEGEGREGPKVIASTFQALLGDVAVGASMAQTFTITNGGDYPLFIQRSFVVTGTPLMFPTTSDTCSGQIVEPGASCEITILFKPTTPGEKGAALLVFTNSIPGINVLGIEGMGVSPSTPALQPVVPRPGPLVLAPGISPVERLRGGTLTTRVIATCPQGTRRCQALSFLTTTLPVHASSRRGLARLAVLGSGTVTLGEGESSTMKVRLRPRALALLRRRGHLVVTLTTVLRSGPVTIATRASTLVLHPHRAEPGHVREAAPRMR